MSRIDAKLLEKLKKTIKLSRSRVYALIDNKVQETSLPRNVAALLVARDWHVNFSQFATEEDLAMMRGVGHAPATNYLAPIADSVHKDNLWQIRKSAVKKRAVSKKPSKIADTVFVVHGRNLKARDELATFLRTLDIKVIEWPKAVALTKKPNPYIAEVIDAGFENAQAIVVLLTPDDEARLMEKLLVPSDQAFERKPTGQPRQNVLFEAGMAFAKYNATTVLVRMGNLRPMSDVAGIHIQHLSDSAPSRKQFVNKLKIAGVVLNDNGEDWLSAGKFDKL